MAVAAKRVLVVEDERIVARDLRETLVEHGYEVVAAVTTGEEAIVRASQHNPELILMDIRLAGKLDGISAAQEILSTQDIPIVYLTSHGDGETLERAKTTNPFGYVLKPFKGDDVRCAIEVAMQQFTHQRRTDHLAELSTARRQLQELETGLAIAMRAPLRAIEASLDDHGGDVTKLKAGVRRMRSLIDHLLMLSRVTSAEMLLRPVDVTALVETIAKRLEITVDVAEGLVMHGDPHWIRALFDELIGNAKKFTRYTADARIEVFASKGGVCVRDNGAGFDQTEAAHMFSPFVRAHGERFEGDGLGLAIVDRIVERHGGRVWAEAGTERGATFYVLL
ncbi:MAG: response regulator [Kofleriaceae bacterium]